MNSSDALLILIFGASGSGKTTLMRELRASGAGLTIHKKGTDRAPKKYDSDEIECLPEVSQRHYQYIYRNYGFSYGIQREQIDKALDRGLDHCIICNDIDTIRLLRKDYGERVRVLFLLFDAPRKHIELVQKRRGISDDQVDLRLSKIGVLSELFLDNISLFDGVILNRLGTPPNDMVRQVEAKLGRNYTGTRLVDGVDRAGLHDMVEVIQIIHQNLQRPDFERVALQPGYLFIIMAMIKSDPALEDVHMAIKRAATLSGLRAERVDDIAFTDQVTDKVLGSIRCAECIVADLTHGRPNVYYEIGYAHAYRKPTVLTARKGTIAHFDIQGFPIIYYESASMLERELVRFLDSFQGPE